MKKQRVTLATSPGTQTVVDARVQGGLAVHRDLDGVRWAVTHIESGVCVVQVRLRKQAVKVLEMLLPLTDWLMDEESLLGKRDVLKPAILLAVEAATKDDKG